MSEREPCDADWDDLLVAAGEFQGVILGAVLVGGTAAAVRVRHRFSTDADHVIEDLRQRFGVLLSELDQRPDWKTARARKPMAVLTDAAGPERTIKALSSFDLCYTVPGKYRVLAFGNESRTSA